MMSRAPTSGKGAACHMAEGGGAEGGNTSQVAAVKQSSTLAAESLVFPCINVPPNFRNIESVPVTPSIT
ncbi:hypothetical protein E2C01_033752 [Portunus trituberculatus]|uniref:Uncharacterized protein n=1 Tax=Portunus trituberculatus TaxID=210409 RepID=A0A5B7F494_PORTR|nr:hypothetical protein [Portunus trituberculatus]